MAASGWGGGGRRRGMREPWRRRGADLGSDVVSWVRGCDPAR